jgi:6-phosphofructokinase 2
MSKIITLTVNPVIDKSTNVVAMVPNRKLRCTNPVYYAGGGGINVSRAIKNLGGTSLAIFLAGGRSGKHLRELLGKDGIPHKRIDLEGATRENFSITETNTDLHYRFGLPGPFVTENEWQASLSLIEKNLKANDFLVASGKLTLGLPNDYYIKVGEIVKQKKAKLVLDTKGEALKHAVKTDIFLFKPNLSELTKLYGLSSISYKSLEEIVRKYLSNHNCEIMVVSLGKRGALLATSEVLEYIPAPLVPEKNTIGAGDSMVAGMLVNLLAGKSFLEMVQYGVACGASATMQPAAQLCQKNHADKLFKWMNSKKNIKLT